MVILDPLLHFGESGNIQITALASTQGGCIFHISDRLTIVILHIRMEQHVLTYEQVEHGSSYLDHHPRRGPLSPNTQHRSVCVAMSEYIGH